MERTILVALMKAWLKKRFDELGREIGSNLGDTKIKPYRHMILSCLIEAFDELSHELKEKWKQETSKENNN